MANTMEIFSFWFGVTRMALNTEKDILVVYSKRNVCFYYGRVIHVITLFFYGEYDGNIFILIWRHQDGLERREEHPGGVQQDKTSILNYLLATGCCSRTVLHQNVALFWFCIVMANSSILYNILILKLIYKIYSNKLKLCNNLYKLQLSVFHSKLHHIFDIGSHSFQAYSYFASDFYLCTHWCKICIFWGTLSWNYRPSWLC